MVYRLNLAVIALTMACLCAHSAKINAPMTMKSAGEQGAIQYPGPTMEDTKDTKVPEQCRGKNYCTVKPKDYPEEKFNEMFKDYKAPAENFQPVLLPSLDNRQGSPDEVDNCESIVTYEPLYQVRNKRGDWKEVVQAPKSAFVQKVRLETCVSANASCFTAFGMQDEFQTFCRQKYNTWEVLVSDGKDGTEKLKTELPVCCSCHYKPLDIASRIAGGKIIRTSTPIKN